MDRCVFCESSLNDGQEVVTLRVNGCQGIEQASQIRGNSISTSPGQRVHAKCRHSYCNKRRIMQSLKRSHEVASEGCGVHVSLRSGETTFNFKENCLFCGHSDTFDSKHQRGHKLIPVRSLSFQEAILQQCNIINSKWSEKVLARINSVHDLPAADAVYHQICSSNFRTGKSIPLVFKSDADEQPVQKRGRLKDPLQEEAFLQVMEDLHQNDEEQTTINDLIDSMKTYPGESGSMPYSFMYMKQKIEDHYGDSIIIAEINGKSNVVTFTATASKILCDFHEQSKRDDSIRGKKKIDRGCSQTH